ADAGSDVAAAVLALLERPLKTRTDAGKADLKALRAFYEMRKGRPLWVSADGLSTDGGELLTVLRRADDFGLDADDYALPDAAIEDLASAAAKADIEVALSRLALRYAHDARGGRVDPSRLSYEIFVERPLRDPAGLLTDFATADAPADTLEALHPQHDGFKRLQAAYVKLRDSHDEIENTDVDLSDLPKRERRKLLRKRSRDSKERARNLRRIRTNLEFWRWLPEELGSTHIMANIPEFRVRVKRDGAIAFSERVIVGKGRTQTPLFSDQMDHVVFRPIWSLPNSLKVKKLLPGLLRGRDSVSGQGLRIKVGNRTINPRAINWRRNDIRNYHVYQPPGPGNALGNVKFMFPNKHAIYMHDTPSKNLFNTRQRTHSAGCVRVRNPDQFAQVVLGIANDWSEDEVMDRFRRGPDNDRVDFDRVIPVHLGYFTARVNEETGEVEYFKDIYKHERHLRFALAGQYNRIVRVKRSVEADVQRIRASARPQGNDFDSWWGGGSSSWGNYSSNGSTGSGATSRRDWASRAFNSNN
ncbi:MAG: L,D-transpeptidase family protein, partial [Pseudomonadota bacterium]